VEIVGWTIFLAWHKVKSMTGLQWFAYLHTIIVSFGLFVACEIRAGDKPERLFIPLLDPASQSNVIVSVLSASDKGDPCPVQYYNVLSNTNLFTLEQRVTIKEALVKYKNVTTNSGPPGTVLISFYITNLVASPPYWVGTNAYWGKQHTNELWVSTFQHTNSGDQEEIKFGLGISAKFTNKSNDGYNVSIARTGNGSLLSFTERKHGSVTGLLVRFADVHAQGITWDRRLADFSEGRLEEYMQTTNGMAFGKWLLWNPTTGGLIMAADCKDPYDWNNHRVKQP
jgi:hypothetical protein